ncbi:ribosome maturation factor RimM [Priestia filamentosa]|uniref:Ribosome maturation factor RimM n=1 Tax=Priestia filamentosa TaxID=1402861 RepID=A0A1X7D5S2_9BACI|nr:ribosome maturation factor RimM [Priestia filamentosa]AKO93862.1 ribosome maturation factor RimM [Priestia filamentosa]MDT3764101.1 ribosome maturation factor RimM [Priestia filamentosa]OXS71425.1 ribosome maturation factor RimM [Priestia filamentosa]RJS67068.1 ribosome maturation factor RimM [Priestia filamentosa]WCM14735.1 ribosome maturation factor RimM [Priestia filamentosa]
MEKWLNVGKIVNTHGVRGEVRVISRTDFPEERYKVGNELYIFKGNEEIKVVVASHRQHKNFDLLTFEEYHNINQVEAFKNCLLKVPSSDLVELEEGEYYFHEIVGCEVYTEEGNLVGTIKEILATGANDVWVVKASGRKDVLIPYIEDVVADINVEEKRVIINEMEGLLD